MGADAEVLVRAQRRVGTTLCGKYRIDRVLGVGGMAVVYSATHRMQKQFAVKMLHPELSLREDLRQRFLREGVAANSVKHPGAVAVTDNDTTEDGAAFLVMELLEGDEVQRLCEMYGGRMPVERVLAIAHQLLDVLAAAHVKAIVHRDIKPANLFVTYEGQLKVLDFGIARVRDAAASGAHATGTGMLLGTPAFMAPEQAYAKASEIDGQTDVWAVGATMFFLLGGQIVHDGENASQIMIQAATVKARSLASVASSAPQSVAYLVDRALAFQKADRWPSAAAMRDATHEAYIAIFGRPITREALAVMWSETDETQAMTREGVRAAQAAARVAPQAVAATRDASLPAVRPVPTHDALVPGVRPVSTLVEPPPTDRASGPSGTHRVTWAAAPIQAPRFDLVGGTTSQPVSSATAPMPAAGVAPKRGRVVLAIGIAAGLLLLGGAAASGLRAMGDGHGAALAPPPTAAPIPSATAVASTAIAASFPSAQPEPPDAGTLASSKAPAATRPALTAATPARPPTTATSTAVPATSPKPNCDVPFQVDSQGIQRIRPECKKQ